MICGKIISKKGRITHSIKASVVYKENARNNFSFQRLFKGMCVTKGAFDLHTVYCTGKMDGYTGTESTQWTYTHGTNMVLYMQR